MNQTSNFANFRNNIIFNIISVIVILIINRISFKRFIL